MYEYNKPIKALANTFILTLVFNLMQCLQDLNYICYYYLTAIQNARMR